MVTVDFKKFLGYMWQVFGDIDWTKECRIVLAYDPAAERSEIRIYDQGHLSDQSDTDSETA